MLGKGTVYILIILNFVVLSCNRKAECDAFNSELIQFIKIDSILTYVSEDLKDTSIFKLKKIEIDSSFSYIYTPGFSTGDCFSYCHILYTNSQNDYTMKFRITQYENDIENISFFLNDSFFDLMPQNRNNIINNNYRYKAKDNSEQIIILSKDICIIKFVDKNAKLWVLNENDN